MINERLALQAADREKVAVSENELNQQLQQLRNTLAMTLGRQPSDAEFAQAVKNDFDMELSAFRENLRKQMTVQKYLLIKKENNFRSIQVPTEAEIRTQFNAARSQFVRPETVRLSMIQVPYGSDAASRTRAKELADRLLREIGSSASRFDEVVARGQAPNSGYLAGDFGYLPKNPEAQAALGQDFMNTAFSLRQGEISRLIEGIPGFLIIKVTENYATKNLELEDIIMFGTNITVKDYIGNALLQERQQRTLAQASEELVTELRANGKSFQVNNAYLTW
jgi:parvulin-like peptidyl-prolyl isomerase